MRRGGFKPAWTPKPAKQIDYVPRPRVPVLLRPPKPKEHSPQPKDAPVRDEAYRRLVANDPCCHCGIVGYSQAAHSDSGKGMGIKASDDEIFALCGPHWSPSVNRTTAGCHVLFGASGLLSKAHRRELEARYARETRIRHGRARIEDLEEGT